MSNKFTERNIKNRTYYFFHDMINIKDHDQIISRQMKSHTKTFLFIMLDTWQMTNLSYIKGNCVNPLYLINKINGYIRESH